MSADYSKTVNLPRTGFSMKANLPAREPETLVFWKDKRVYERLAEKNGSNPKFILHDGPPYANGKIHIGHALNKILKDTIVKYRSMAGFSSPYIPGWDCHGLPIEQQLLKDLKSEGKVLDRVAFRARAREFAAKFVEIQKADFIRLGVWADWDRSYLTMSRKYESAIIRVFGDLVEAGFIYRSRKPIHWCPVCATALSISEVEYADHSSPSVYVKFRVKSLPGGKAYGGSVLIWTTTPWTLPANVALAFNPDFDYVSVKYDSDSGPGEVILAEKLLEQVSKNTGMRDTQVTGRFKGKELEGLVAENPVVQRGSRGILAAYVSLEDGTGVVHIAPGHGADDYNAGLKYRLPVISPVDARGRFTDEVPEFSGKKVFEANPLIIEKLKASGALLATSVISHSYPVCWRCRKPIIFRATEQWFMDIERGGTRSKMLDSLGSVEWVPAYMRNRMEAMVQGRPDWCLSRQRHWGVPIPVLYCEQCEKPLLDPRVIRKYQELTASEGSDSWFTKDISELLPAGVKCECGGEAFKREQDILDVWFDSGVSHEAVLADPEMGLEWPAHVYLEGSDQHRGWFQTSLIPAAALRGGPPYRTVITHGFVVDSSGHKMSKSEGNVVAPQEITGKYGAEILRLWACSSDYSEDIRISNEIIERLTETYRKIRNTFRFALGNICDFDPAKDAVERGKLWEADAYMLHRLQELVAGTREAYEKYEFHSVVSKVNNFCVQDLSSFYLDTLKDRLYTYGAASEGRRSCQTVIYELLTALLRLTAPVLSFTAEEAWQSLRGTPAGAGLEESVFLAGLPEARKEFMVSDTVVGDWTAIKRWRDAVNIKIEEKRKEGVIGSSLEARVILTGASGKDYGLLEKYSAGKAKSTWQSVLIVSQVEIREDKSVTPEPWNIVVEHAPGVKCPRCWNWTPDGEPKAEDGLCGRCAEAIK